MATSNAGTPFHQGIDMAMVVVAFALAMIPHGAKMYYVKKALEEEGGGEIDNSNPRAQVAFLSSKSDNSYAPLISRLQNAHINGLEALALFGISVALARTSPITLNERAGASIAFVCLRFVYNVLFWVGNSNGVGALRSLVWIGGLVCCLFLLCRGAYLSDQIPIF